MFEILFKNIKFKTIFNILLLFIAFAFSECAINAARKTPDTVEEALAQREKLKKSNARKARRETKKKIKAYWASQSPEVRKSVKRNAKNQKKAAKKREKKQKKTKKKTVSKKARKGNRSRTTL